MLFKIILVSLAIVLISFLLIGLNIIFFRKKFPETSIGHNKHMMNLGIKCVRCEEVNKIKIPKKKPSINPNELKIAID